MPQFNPSSSHVATVPIQVKPAGLACVAELYLVSGATKVATSGEIPFVSTGATQPVIFPVTMPASGGTYPVWIDVYTGGVLIGAYVALEAVVIAAVAPEFKFMPPFAIGVIYDPTKGKFDVIGFVHNTGAKTGTGIVSWYTEAYAEPFASQAVTLAPGETKSVLFPSPTGPRGVTLSVYLRGDWGEETRHITFTTGDYSPLADALSVRSLGSTWVVLKPSGASDVNWFELNVWEVAPWKRILRMPRTADKYVNMHVLAWGLRPSTKHYADMENQNAIAEVYFTTKS